MRLLIGLTGRARVGKDTVARRLENEWGFEQYSFAGPLKAMLRAGFGLDGRHLEGDLKEVELPWLGKSPRQLMQTLGTEWGREQVAEDVWLRLADRAADRIELMVVSDVRFENEAAWVRSRGGLLVHIIRPDAVQVSSHASEAGVKQLAVDYQIYNHQGLAELNAVVDNMARTLKV